MEVGILGLAGSGKTTLFKLLTSGASAQGDGVKKGRPTVGIGRVADPRLDLLSTLFSPRKTTAAVVRFVDVPTVECERRESSSLNTPELRTMDALLVVLRAHDNEAVPHPLGSIDPFRDLQRIEEELILQDQIVVERRLERLQRDLSKRPSGQLAAEAELLQRCLTVLGEVRPLRSERFSDDEKTRLRGFEFLSAKPILAVVNTGENDATCDCCSDPRWNAWLADPATARTTVCATLEQEIAELGPADAAEFMAELGIADRAIDRVAREAYGLLGLISFFTVGEDECRAWSIPSDTIALEAARAIHSDISRGFIRAEVVDHATLLELGSLAACKQEGALRLEGKEYVVQDGDVVHYRFAV